ncbi:MAG: sigma-70 family RNA polymerase sigma factor [Phycisphaerae bacterium]|nr:sigma-70 family RNA polymerase sigma factor [Phycisphaerae bacterium]
MAQAAALPLELRSLLASLTSAEVAESQQWILRLLRGQGTAVLTALWRMLGSEADVLDAYQTAVCRLTARGQQGVGANPAGYFYRIAVNAAIETLRTRQRQKAHWSELVESRANLPPPPGVTVVCDEREALERMRLAISELPRHLREVVILRDLGQMRYAEVAGVLGITAGTARLYRRQAVIRLAELIGEEVTG